MNMIRTGFLLALLGGAFSIQADTVDNFDVPQGPITLGPGEEPNEDEASDFPPGVLGGFRIMTPVVDEDAPAGSTATASIGGGELECVMDFSTANDVHGGGCAVAWADVNERAFDFTNAEAFEFEVLESAPGTLLAIFLINGTVDPNNVIPTGELNGVIGFIENPTPGSYTLPIEDFINPLNPFFNFDLSTVTNVLLNTAFVDGSEGTIRIGPVSTTGAIGGGPPIDPPDTVEKEDVTGTWFDPLRDGEGCQISLEADDSTVVLSCYVYQDGEQAWFIGAGTYADGEVDFNPLVITTGAGFGDNFDTNDVIRSNWGVAGLVMEDCNNALLTLIPEVPDFEPINLDLTKVVQANCDAAAPAAAASELQGTLYDPARDGEGVQIALLDGQNLFGLTWYTYVQGRQAWVVGSGVRSGNTIQFNDLIITRGADFGSAFDPADVVRETWGNITLEFSDCNRAILSAVIQPGQPLFSDYSGPVEKLIQGLCE